LYNSNRLLGSVMNSVMNKVLVVGTSLLVFTVVLECSEIGVNTGTLTAAEKQTDAKHMREVSGEVTAIDRDGKTITVGGIIILVDEEMLSDIKEGDTVTVDYFTRGMNKAVLIMPEQK